MIRTDARFRAGFSFSYEDSKVRDIEAGTCSYLIAGDATKHPREGARRS